MAWSSARNNALRAETRAARHAAVQRGEWAGARPMATLAEMSPEKQRRVIAETLANHVPKWVPPVFDPPPQTPRVVVKLAPKPKPVRRVHVSRPDTATGRILALITAGPTTLDQLRATVGAPNDTIKTALGNLTRRGQIVRTRKAEYALTGAAEPEQKVRVRGQRHLKNTIRQRITAALQAGPLPCKAIAAAIPDRSAESVYFELLRMVKDGTAMRPDYGVYAMKEGA